jgi:hydroxyacylglutathione hydrolase
MDTYHQHGDGLMKTKQFRYGRDNLGYIVSGDTEAVAIDGGAVAEILEFLNDRGLSLKYVTNTHSHGDHTVGNSELLNRTDAEFLGPEALAPGGSIEIDGGTIEVTGTPGHTSDSVCFHYDGVLIAGDTLFNGKVGRCFTGDPEGFFRSISTLMELPDDTLLYAGHDYVEEYIAFSRELEPDNAYIEDYMSRYDPDHVVSTLGEERQVNPFLRLREQSIISMLEKKGLPTGTDYERWWSLLALM